MLGHFWYLDYYTIVYSTIICFFENRFYVEYFMYNEGYYDDCYDLNTPYNIYFPNYQIEYWQLEQRRFSEKSVDENNIRQFF